MKKLFMFLVLILISSCSAEKEKGKTEADILIDSLFSPTFNYKYKHDLVEDLFRQIQSKGDLVTDHTKLYDFVKTNSKYDYLAMQTLVYLKLDDLDHFILQNHQFFCSECFSKICSALDWTLRTTDSTTHHAYNSKILDILIPIAAEHENTEVKRTVFRAVDRIGTYAQIKKLVPIFPTLSENGLRGRVLTALLRYKDEKFDEIIINELTNHFDYSSFIYIACYRLKFYNRHDYLPYFYKIKQQMENEKDIRKIEEAQKVLKVFEKLNLIPYLEQKKAEGVKPGLPLDWGVVE